MRTALAHPPWQRAQMRARSRAQGWRIGLICGCLLLLGLAALPPADPSPTAAALTRLLRGLALIKAALSLGGLGIAYWRLGYPISNRLAGLYAACVAAACAASLLVWRLVALPLAATLFDLALVLFLIGAWRDTQSVGNAGAQRSKRA